MAKREKHSPLSSIENEANVQMRTQPQREVSSQELKKTDSSGTSSSLPSKESGAYITRRSHLQRK
eukprot:3634481-Ditylum_brightwellii.AAC.1